MLDFLQTVYNIFGFKLILTLSTRPEKFLGEIEQWNEAEKVRCIAGYCYRIVSPPMHAVAILI